MAVKYIRKVNRRRKPSKPKRNYKRGGAYRLNKVYSYKRIAKSLAIYNTATASTITTNDVSQINLSAVQADTVGSMFGASMQFRLANASQSTDFTTLYDQYKISGVKVQIIPLSDSANAQNTGFLPTLYWARDNDSAGTVPTTEASLRERQDIKVLRLNRPVSIYIKAPKSMADVVNVDGTLLPSQNTFGWIDCNAANVAHNGLMMWFKNVDLRSTATTTTAFRFEVTYYLKFRNPQ